MNPQSFFLYIRWRTIISRKKKKKKKNGRKKEEEEILSDRTTAIPGPPTQNWVFVPSSSSSSMDFFLFLIQWTNSTHTHNKKEKQFFFFRFLDRRNFSILFFWFPFSPPKRKQQETGLPRHRELKIRSAKRV